MGILDKYKDLINASFSKWIKVEDNQSKWTIEDFPYNEGVNEDITKPHCWKCVTVNKCWFKNEENKKPKKFDYAIFSSSELLKIIRGLYHPKCHCKEFAINSPKIEDIELIVPEGKIEYLFSNKVGWVNYMGYHNEDYDEFIKALFYSTKKAYVNGDYYMINHDKQGFKINLEINIPGINEKIGKIFKIKTGYMIFTEGKLKMNTPLGGWVK